MAIQITITDLTEKVEAGWKKQALAIHYGLPVTQMTKVLQHAGLRIRKFHAPKFVLVDDRVQEVVDTLQDVDYETTFITEAFDSMVDVETTVEAVPTIPVPGVPEAVTEEVTSRGTW